MNINTIPPIGPKSIVLSILVGLQISYGQEPASILTGIAIIKEQLFHPDESAMAIAYVTLNDDGWSTVKINTGKRIFTMDRKKLVTKIDYLKSIPENITDESEVNKLRYSLKTFQDFSDKYTKSTPLLLPQIKALNNHIKKYEGGEVRVLGQWINGDEWLADQREKAEKTAAAQLLQKKKDEKDKRDAVERLVEEKRLLTKKKAFEKSQREKGLEVYDGQWLPSEKVRILIARDTRDKEIQAREEAQRIKAQEEQQRALAEGNHNTLKYWYNWNMYNNQLINSRHQLQLERKKIPIEETKMYVEQKNKKDIDAFISKKKKHLDFASSRLDQKGEKLKWLSRRIKTMIESGSDDQSTNRLVKRVMEGKITIGMDAETVLVSWGKPNDVNKIIRSGLTTEQWIYGTGINKRKYIHFSNGFVVSMSDF